MKEYIRIKMNIQELLDGEFKDIKYIGEVANTKANILDIIDRQYEELKKFAERII